MFTNIKIFGLKTQLFLWKQKGNQPPCKIQLREVNLGICSKAGKIFQRVLGKGWTRSNTFFSQDGAGSITLDWAVRPWLLGDQLLFFPLRSLASWTLSSGQATFGLCLRRQAGIPRASGMLRTPWRSNPAAITKVATTKTAMGQLVATTSQAPTARWVNMASPRAMARVGQPPSLIKYRVHTEQALVSLMCREFNRSQVSVAPGF